MKKFGMLFLALVMILLTSATYIYENHYNSYPKYKKSSINIKSSKFGNIKNIIWKRGSEAPELLILTSKKEKNKDFSYLYHLEINTGHSMLLGKFPSHKYLNDMILYDNSFSSDDVIAAYDEGIIRFKLNEDNHGKLVIPSPSELAIDGFSNATSMDLKGHLFYSKANDNLIYSKELPRGGFSNLFNQNKTPDLTTYYKKPFYIVATNSLERTLNYTSINKGNINLYSMNYDGIQISVFNKPLVKNIVTAKSIYDSYGFIGMNIKDMKDSANNEQLNIFMRRDVNKYGASYHLDTIPFNCDKFGGVPDIDSDTYNEDYTLVYTCYDKNGYGHIKEIRYGHKPKLLINDKNIYGPVRLMCIYNDNKKNEYLLYFTHENNSNKIKVYNTNSGIIKDITDQFF